MHTRKNIQYFFSHGNNSLITRLIFTFYVHSLSCCLLTWYDGRRSERERFQYSVPNIYSCANFLNDFSRIPSRNLHSCSCKLVAKLWMLTKNSNIQKGFGKNLQYKINIKYKVIQIWTGLFVCKQDNNTIYLASRLTHFFWFNVIF